MSNSKSGGEVVLSNSRRVFQAERFHVERHAPGDRGRQRHIVVHPGAVVVLPLHAGDQVVMIRNHRVALDRTLWELPAGTLEVGEDPGACARRELIEETGFCAGSIEALLTFYSAPGFCTERLYAFVAQDLREVGQRLEPGEQISVALRSWTDLLSMIRSNEIEDAKTIAVLLHYWTFGRGDPIGRAAARGRRDAHQS